MPLLYVVNRYPWVAGDTDPWSHFTKLASVGALLVCVASYGLYRLVEAPAIAWSHAARQRPPDIDAVAVLPLGSADPTSDLRRSDPSSASGKVVTDAARG